MSKTILSVDDSKPITDMVSFTLEPEGFRVVSAQNGQDALEKLRSERPDLVFTDLNMPVMDGITFITHARADPAGSGVPIVMLTTESATEMKEKGKLAGATGWLNKPFDADKLIAITRKLLG